MVLRRWRFPVVLMGVLVIVAAVYAPTVNDYFGGDDFLVIGPVHNMGPWELIWRSLILRDNIPYWRPLVSPLYAVEVHGFWLRPWAYHLVALGLHLTNVALLALLALALTGRRGVALAAGLLFGLHAAHTTTVAQISSTVELLSVVWYLTTVLFAVRWVRGPLPPAPSPAGGRGGDVSRSPQPRNREDTSPPLPPCGGGGRGEGAAYLLSLVAFALALLSKESTASAAGVVTVLFALFILVPGLHVKRFVLAVAPFWLLVIPYIAFTFITDTDDPTGIISRMYFVGGHIGQNMWWFLSRLAAPFAAGQGPEVTTLGHAGAALLLIGAVAVLARGTMQARFLVLWTGIALTPLALWRPELLLGRFTYQASAPFAVLLALGGAWVADRAWRSLGTSVLAWAPGCALTLAAVAVLAPLTVVQNRDRTREGDSYRVLVTGLRREFPQLAPGSEVVLVDGVWSGPFHALYLDAVADTLYGAGNVTIVNVGPGDKPKPTRAATLRLRYDGAALRLDTGPQ